MTKSPTTLGIILFIATMIVFFVVYFFFSGINYFDISLKVNAFLLPVLYAAAAFWSVKSLWNRKKLNFKEAFRSAFYPMFIGGFLSVLSIFAFLNFVDTDAKALLNYQFVERNKSELVKIYETEKTRLKSDKEREELEKDYKKSIQSFNDEQVKGKDMLTLRHFSVYFSAILIFYLVLSLFFGAFFRTKNTAEILEEK
ncbi:DUF4199 domain-containing protein [Chryseobacterium sp.]|uniref:DUF4199 domain-containing protein n=1 Tax=Chryseobacterium sp. TaxID=1871047 RepID=UPI00289ACF2E|nr:DUF4199 domain-containing protein [Chryseobacterium sp.]